MSRSYRKTPIFGICYGNDTPFKKMANKKFRRKTKRILQRIAILEPEDTSGPNCLPQKLREISNVWDWPMDGKAYMGPIDNWVSPKATIEEQKECRIHYHKQMRK